MEKKRRYTTAEVLAMGTPIPVDDEPVQTSTGTPKKKRYTTAEVLAMGTPIPVDDDESSEPVVPKEPKYSMPESALLGAAQGAALGFGDEGAAVLETIPKAVKDLVKNHKISPQALYDFYKKSRDQLRGNINQASEENPISYGIGDLAGNLGATAVIPGAAETTIPKMAALGAVGGLGTSKVDLFDESQAPAAVRDTVGGAALGGAMPLIAKPMGMALSKAANAVGDYGGRAAKQILSSTFGPSREAIDKRLSDPEALKNASSFVDLAYQLPKSFKDLQDQIKLYDEHAWSKLSNSPAIEEGGRSKQSVLKMLDSMMKGLEVNNADVNIVDLGAPQSYQNLGVVGKANQKALDHLGYLKSQIEKFPQDALSEQTQKQIIQSLDQDINWADVNAKPTNMVLEKLRTNLDNDLKAGNSSYADAMQPVADRVKLLKDAQNQYAIKSVAGKDGGSFEPSDITPVKIANALNEEKRSQSNQTLQTLSDLTGEDYLDKARNVALNNQFYGGRANGSRMVNLGALAGSAATGMAGAFLPDASERGGLALLGGVAGGLTGALIDKRGRQYAGNMIDFYLKHNPQRLGKYAPILANAAQQGGRELAVRNFVLSQTDPEYQKMMQDISKEQK